MRRLLMALVVATPLMGCGLYYEHQRREWEDQFRRAHAAWQHDVRAQMASLCLRRGQTLPTDYSVRQTPMASGGSFYLAVELETLLRQPRPCGLSRAERTRIVNEADRRHLLPLKPADHQQVVTWLHAVDLMLADLFDQGKIRPAQAEFLALEARRLGYGELEDRRMRGAAVRAQQSAAAAQQSQADAAWGRIFQEQWRLSQPGKPIPVGPMEIRIVP